ncbi:MAG: ABC transporter permease subunit [Alistipes sp.]
MFKRILIFMLLAFVVSCTSKEKKYTCLDDAVADKIGVLLGSADDAFATQTYPKAIIMRAPGISDLILMLKREKCDAIMLDDIILQSAVKGDPAISLLDENVSEHSTGIAFGINNPDLKDKFNTMLEELRDDGTLDQMYQRWFSNIGPDAPKVEMPELDLPQTGTPLQVGISGEEIPFSFVQDQEIVGHDIELMRHFSKYLGRPVQFEVIPFGGLIAALSSETIDAIAVGLTITEERQKNVAFATPHYTTNTVACILTKNLAVKPKSAVTTANISTKRICVLQKSAEDAYVTTNFPNAKIIRCATYADALTNLTSEKCDAAMFSKASYNSLKKSNPQVVMLDSTMHLNDGVMLVLEKNLAHGNQVTQEGEKQGFFASVKDSFYNNIIAEKRYMLILNGLWQTLLISIFAALLGTIFGALVCFMRMSKNTLMNAIAKTYTIIMRGIPVLVLLMLLYYAVFAKWDINATIVAIITFALNFAAYVSEMFRTSIEGVDRGQSEAGIAMGFTKVKTFILIIMPQAIKSVLPVYKGELISMIKMTSVVGYIAVEDLTKASDIIRSRTFDAFFPLVMVAIIYFFLAWGFTATLDRLNKKMTSR